MRFRGLTVTFNRQNSNKFVKKNFTFKKKQLVFFYVFLLLKKIYKLLKR